MAYRLLNTGESLIVQVLLDRADDQRWRGLDLALLRVRDMEDGGMGSLRFQSVTPDRLYGRTLAEGWYTDEDGVPVVVALYLDRDGNIFELDSWKVDFSPLRRFPSSARVIFDGPTRMD